MMLRLDIACCFIICSRDAAGSALVRGLGTWGSDDIREFGSGGESGVVGLPVDGESSS
jgi:hypothetical protein